MRVSILKTKHLGEYKNSSKANHLIWSHDTFRNHKFLKYTKVSVCSCMISEQKYVYNFAES